MATEDQDLPINSCHSAWKVLHYMFDLRCLLEEKLFRGVVLLFIERRNEVDGCDLVLDCRDLVFQGAAEVSCSREEWTLQLGSSRFGDLQSWFSREERTSLDCEADDWCIRVKGLGNNSPAKVVYLDFSTKTDGRSVLWRESQDGNKCVYTAGSLVNNRGLFPCQDGPGFMATWQAVVHFPAEYTCLCTGDEMGESVAPTSMYFYTEMLLPMSTFAIAIGKWKEVSNGLIEQNSVETEEVTCRHEPYPCHFRQSGSAAGFRYRVFSPLSVDVSSVLTYIPDAIKRCGHTFGRIPVPRVDFLFMPRCFSSLGLCSPNLIFLSQSVVAGRRPMLHRIAHELSHFWFGVNIGPKNWTEEWMSEGFATYAEDLVHASLEPHFCRGVRTLNRWQVLQADLVNVDQELQILTPTLASDTVVKNGLNEEKIFSQIHYIKGYFLLLELENNIGLDNFMIFLKKYVEAFHGCLVSAEEFLNYYREFSFLLNLNDGLKDLDAFKQKWLYSSNFEVNVDNLKNSRAYRQVVKHIDYWKVKRCSKKRTRKQKLDEIANDLQADQLIAVLDHLLLAEKRFSQSVVRDVMKFYDPQLYNPDVEHRCCEIIVQNQYAAALKSVVVFLEENQSMGVYLYGELMLTEKYRFQNAARELYARLEGELEPPLKNAIKELLQI